MRGSDFQIRQPKEKAMNTSSAAFQSRLKAWTTQIDLLQKFADAFADKLPLGVASISMDSYYDKPTCSISTGYSGEDRSRSLALAGEVFGTTGWMKSMSHDKDFYHWNREISGVTVTIYKADPIPMEQDKQPVPPTAFPLMLKEVA